MFVGGQILFHLIPIVPSYLSKPFILPMMPRRCSEDMRAQRKTQDADLARLDFSLSLVVQMMTHFDENQFGTVSRLARELARRTKIGKRPASARKLFYLREPSHALEIFDDLEHVVEAPLTDSDLSHFGGF